VAVALQLLKSNDVTKQVVDAAREGSAFGYKFMIAQVAQLTLNLSSMPDAAGRPNRQQEQSVS
jgi:hypothetical protein